VNVVPVTRTRRIWALAATVTVLTTSAAAAPPPGAPPGCTPPTDGRAALWRGEDDARDSVAEHHGSLEGGAGFRDGRVGRALSLAGAGAHVSVPGASDLDLLGDLTVEAWIELDSDEFEEDRMIILKPGPGFLFWVEGDATSAQASPLRFAAGSYGEPGGIVDSEPLAWTADTWYHVAATRRGDTVAFYRDGSPVGSATITQRAISEPAAHLALGAYPEAGQVYNSLRGGLDELGLWDRALAAAEVRALVDTATGACATVPAATPSAGPSPAPDTIAPETTILDGTPNGQEIRPGTPPATYIFASDDPHARFECRAFDTTAQRTVDTGRLFWSPCQSPYTSALDVRRPSAYAFEVRAVDAAGNRDPTPARRGLIRHADPDVPAVDRKPDRCTMVSVGAVRGSTRRLLPGCRLARIRNGRVPCLHSKTLEKARCRFTTRSGAWVHSRTKRGPRFALVGEPVSRNGKRRGAWIVAAQRGGAGRGATTVECAKPPAVTARTSDTAGRVAPGQELSRTCLVEDNLAAYNAIGPNGWKPLYNWTDGEVCMRNHPDTRPHPDFPELTRLLPDGGACYTGLGAALNDPNGTERDASGGYYAGEEYCHMVVSGGYEVPAAKRPGTRSHPYPGSIQTGTYLVWRTVNYSLDIANTKPPSAYYEGDPTPPQAEY
jgi:hypothetical protein